MKRLIALTLAALLILCSAAAELPDISGLTFDELVALREQLNLAIWQSSEWQEVTVPGGIWEIGKDIPAGHWVVRLAKPSATDTVWVFEKLDRPGMGPDYNYYYRFQVLISENMLDYVGSYPASVDLIMPEGWYFQSSADVVFTPFTGKPALGFK